MKKHRPHPYVAIASLALVLIAAATSGRSAWVFDFAQYRGPQRAEPQDEFRFAIVGDRTGGAIWGLMPQAFREINHLYPDFVISVGDLIDGYGDRPDQINQLWEEFDGEVANLQCPFVYIPGNHDIWNPTSRGVYSARYGPTYRSFNYRGLHFITLDTEGEDSQGRRSGRIQGEQLEWLKEDIMQNRDARQILLFMHRPVWQSGGLDEVYGLLEGLPVHIFAGHYHRYGYQEIRGIPHVILGAVAASMPEDGVEAIGRFRHYCFATVRDKDLKLALVRLGGVMSPDVVLEQDVAAIRQLADACAIYRERTGAGASARIVLRNPLPVLVRLQVQKTSPSAAQSRVKTLFASEELSCPEGQAVDQPVDGEFFSEADGPPGATEYRAVFRFTNGRGESSSIDYPIEPRELRLASAPIALTPPRIDGQLNDWHEELQWLPITTVVQGRSEGEPWQGPDDLSGQFAVTTDDENLYVAVRVVDDLVGYSDSGMDRDGVELFFADPDEKVISFNRDQDWRRLLISPFGSEDSAPGPGSGVTRILEITGGGGWGGRGAGPREFTQGVAAYLRQSDGYVLEVALSRRALGWDQPSDRLHEFDVAINDRDEGRGRESQLIWSGTGRNGFSSRHFGRLSLEALD